MSIEPGLIDIGTFIDQREGYRGGRPFIVGTGVTVDRVSVLYRIDELGPEAIAEDMNLTLPQVHAALSFYLANKETIDREIEEYDRELAEYAREYYESTAGFSRGAIRESARLRPQPDTLLYSHFAAPKATGHCA